MTDLRAAASRAGTGMLFATAVSVEVALAAFFSFYWGMPMAYRKNVKLADGLGADETGCL